MLKETIEDQIVIATLEHGSTNSITIETLKMLNEIVKKVNEDDSLKGIVITGAGKTFSSGCVHTIFISRRYGKEGTIYHFSSTTFLSMLPRK